MIENITDFMVFVCTIILMIIIVFTIAVVLTTPFYFLDKNVYTPNFGKEVQKEVKYNLFAGGCFMRMDNGQWIKCGNYNGINLEN